MLHSGSLGTDFAVHSYTMRPYCYDVVTICMGKCLLYV